MAQIQIEISDEEHRCFLQQAEHDGVTLSEWMKNAAQLHLKSRGLLGEQKRLKPFKSAEDVREFFRLCDELTAEEGKSLEKRRTHEPFASTEPFKSVEEIEEFFRYCDTLDGPEREPDWEEHKQVIHQGKMSAWTGT